MKEIANLFTTATEEDYIHLFCCIAYNEHLSRFKLTILLKELVENVEKPVNTVKAYLNYFDNLNNDVVKAEIEKADVDDVVMKLLRKKVIKNKGLIGYRISDKELIVLDYENKQVLHERERFKGQQQVESSYTKVINAVPTHYVRNFDLFMKQYTHTIYWESKVQNKPFKINKALKRDVKAQLDGMNYILSGKYIDTALSSILQILYENKMFVDKETIETDGFYLHPKTNELITVNYNLPFFKPNLEDLTDDEVEMVDKGLKVVEYLLEESEFDKIKLGFVFKWFLVAPFGFIKKQTFNGFFKWLYLWGNSNTGKTSLCSIFLHMWGKYDSIHNIGGSSANTQYRLGEKMRETSYSVVINEAQGLFENQGLCEMLKTSVESTVSRSRDVNGIYTSFPAFCTCALTSNTNLPKQKELRRRFISIGFNRDEIIKNKDFIKKLKFGRKESCLNHLKAVGAFSASMLYNLERFELDCFELADMIVKMLYVLVNRPVPPALTVKWEEDLEDVVLTEEKTDKFRNFFLERINYSAKGIGLYKFKVQNFQTKLNLVLESESIDWLLRDNKDNIVFRRGIIDEFKGESSLKSLALLCGLNNGFEYVKSKKVNGKVFNCIVVSEENLISFMGYKYVADFYLGGQDDDY